MGEALQISNQFCTAQIDAQQSYQKLIYNKGSPQNVYDFFTKRHALKSLVQCNKIQHAFCGTPLQGLQEDAHVDEEDSIQEDDSSDSEGGQDDADKGGHNACAGLKRGHQKGLDTKELNSEEVDPNEGSLVMKVPFFGLLQFRIWADTTGLELAHHPPCQVHKSQSCIW